MCDANQSKHRIHEDGPRSRRRKIWEIDGTYHCSIVGTCLSMGDLKAIFRKCNFEAPPGAQEYQIHGAMVGLCETRCLVTRQLHKRLDRKHRGAIRRFTKAKMPDEVLALWKLAVEEGDIPGPYWALQSHPATTEAVRGLAFGEVHMLSHLVGAANRADIRALRQLQQQCEDMAAEIASTKADAGRRLRRRDDRIRTLEAAVSASTETTRRLEEAQHTIAELTRGAEGSSLRAENETLTRRVDNLDRHCDIARERHAEALARARQAEYRVRTIEAQLAESRAELAALESDLSQLITARGDCACPESRDCPKAKLCGRSVLYVGGRSQLVQHYRALVQRHGGDFLHHDGGVEDGRSRLPEVLCRADLVLCPLDCVSHDAYNRLKQHCKRLDKPCVFMRSSGLSSLVREIQQLAD